MGTTYVFQSRTTDGSQTTILNYPDQKILVQAWGTWGGATITLQTIAPDNTTYITLTDLTGSAITLTADTQLTVTDFVQNQTFRAVLAGASGSTNLNLTLQQI